VITTVLVKGRLYLLKIKVNAGKIGVEIAVSKLIDIFHSARFPHVHQFNVFIAKSKQISFSQWRYERRQVTPEVA
jgi:hypothetical protein